MNALAKFEKSTSTPLLPQGSMETMYSGFRLGRTAELSLIDLQLKQSGTFDVIIITHPDNDHVFPSSLGALSKPDSLRWSGRMVEAMPRVYPSLCMATQTYPLAGQQFLATTTHNSSANDSQICTYILLTPKGATTGPLLVGYPDNSTPNPTLDTLAQYESLNQPNWDGYGAEPITSVTLDYARRLISVMPQTFGCPDISPSGEGSIALEWIPETGPIHKLFLDIGPGEHWRAYWKRRNGEFGRLPGVAITADTKRILQKLFTDLSK